MALIEVTCVDCATPLILADGDWICPRCNLPEEAKQEPIPTTEERRAALTEELRAAWWGQSADWYESVLERLAALEQEEEVNGERAKRIYS